MRNPNGKRQTPCIKASGNGAARALWMSALWVTALAMAMPGLIAIAGPADGQEAQPQASQEVEIGESGLVVPRFVSLKSDLVNVRIGPSRNHRIKWTFRRAGLPLEIIQEFSNWRRIRDSQGEEGWVFHSLLSGRRTALVAPWAESGRLISLHSRPDSLSAQTARLRPRVQLDITACDATWCEVSGNGVAGFVRQDQIYGVYGGEIFN